MKKIVKSLVIASCVAAVAGVGAVSFAAWSGNSTSQDVTSTTGSLETYGVSVKSNGLSGKVWVPYNQNLTTNLIANGVNIWDIEVKMDGSPTSGYDYKLQINFVADDTDDAMEDCMYVYSSATALDTTSINSSSNINFAAADCVWKKVTGSAANIANLTINDAGTHIYVIFDSSVNAQMSKSVKLVITLDKQASAAD